MLSTEFKTPLKPIHTSAGLFVWFYFDAVLIMPKSTLNNCLFEMFDFISLGNAEQTVLCTRHGTEFQSYLSKKPVFLPEEFFVKSDLVFIGLINNAAQEDSTTLSQVKNPSVENFDWQLLL